MKLSEHFSLEEFEHSQTAINRGIDNTPPQDVIANLVTLAERLEEIRALLKHPLHINSGYRCPDLNKAVNGSQTSAHMDGYAADFTCSEFGTPLDIVQTIVAAEIRFDQCIAEGTWCHISFDPRMRQRLMTAHFDVHGKTTYTAGV